MGGDLLSSSISNVLPAFHSGLPPCQNLLLEGRQYVADVSLDVKLLNHCRLVRKIVINTSFSISAIFCIIVAITSKSNFSLFR